MEKEIALIGLGKMGNGLALNLIEHGWNVKAYNRSVDKTIEVSNKGGSIYNSVKDLVYSIKASPKIVWVMLTAGNATEDVLFNNSDALINILEKDDIVIDGGNSFFKDSKRRAELFNAKGIKYIDVGVSGGPYGARNGACLMIGGDNKTFKEIEPLFKDLSLKGAYKFFNGNGAGHYVKMVHNGIEYGMMQSIAEGFNLLKESDYNFNLTDISEIYNNGSVIESRLTNWLNQGLIRYGEDLKDISGEVSHSGEGEWTVNTAKESNIDVTVIKQSLEFRKQSQGNPSFTGKIVSLLRTMFGGHDVFKRDK